MKSLFEIEWRGGAAEKHFRKLRPLPAELPWGTIDRSRYTPELIERARIAWSSIAVSEYRAAIAFANVASAMLVARAPLDIVGMAGDFVADEVMHAELASRLAMELGGGAPIEVDFETMPITSDAPTPFQRANDVVLRLACISETLSLSVAVEMHAVVEHPLIHAIIEQIARDESRHMRLGWVYMEWAVQDMDASERQRLGVVALQEIQRLSPTWTNRRLPAGISAEQVRELGWLDPETFRARAKKTILEDVVAPLDKLGIAIDAKDVERLFAGA